MVWLWLGEHVPSLKVSPLPNLGRSRSLPHTPSGCSTNEHVRKFGGCRSGLAWVGLELGPLLAWMGLLSSPQ